MGSDRFVSQEEHQPGLDADTLGVCACVWPCVWPCVKIISGHKPDLKKDKQCLLNWLFVCVTLRCCRQCSSWDFYRVNMAVT